MLQDYYFISTSGPSDVHNRVGGFCQSHNMKVVFKVTHNPFRLNKTPHSYFSRYSITKLILFKVLDPEMVAAAAAVEAAKSVDFNN